MKSLSNKELYKLHNVYELYSKTKVRSHKYEFKYEQHLEFLNTQLVIFWRN